MYRRINYLTALCLGLAIAGCARSESQGAGDQADESARSQKLADERDAAARQRSIDEAIERDAAAKQKSIDDSAASTNDAINRNIDSRRSEDKRETTTDRQKAANLKDEAKRATTDAFEADKRAKDAK
jgi:hypothetical protein